MSSASENLTSLAAKVEAAKRDGIDVDGIKAIYLSALEQLGVDEELIGLGLKNHPELFHPDRLQLVNHLNTLRNRLPLTYVQLIYASLAERSITALREDGQEGAESSKNVGNGVK